MNKKRTIIILSILIIAIAAYVGYEGVRERRFLGTVQSSYASALGWLEQNQKENGLFQYIYQPKDGIYPKKNNAIRQLMAARLVAELSKEDERWAQIHKANLDFFFTYWYKVDETEDGTEIGYVLYNDKSKLGANAMLLRTLVASPQYDAYQAEVKQLLNGILHMQQPDGSFLPWYIEPDYGYDADYLLTFYSGEALVSLIEYYEKTNDQSALDAAIVSQDFYINRYVTELEQRYYPAYVPWHTISLYKLYHITGDQKYAEALFALNDKLLEIQDSEEYPGRFYNPDTPEYGTPHSASDGIYTEGLAYAHDLAHEVGDKQRTYRYHRAMELAVKNLVSLQYTLDSIKRESDAWRVVGAFKYDADDARIRIDTTQHAVDAYRVILKTFGAL